MRVGRSRASRSRIASAAVGSAHSVGLMDIIEHGADVGVSDGQTALDLADGGVIADEPLEGLQRLPVRRQSPRWDGRCRSEDWLATLLGDGHIAQSIR